MYTYIHTYVHTYIHTYVHTYICTYIHTYMITYICTYIHTYIYAYIHTYTYIHTHRRTRTHTHTHTHTYIHTNNVHTYTRTIYIQLQGGSQLAGLDIATDMCELRPFKADNHEQPTNTTNKDRYVDGTRCMCMWCLVSNSHVQVYEHGCVTMMRAWVRYISVQSAKQYVAGTYRCFSYVWTHIHSHNQAYDCIPFHMCTYQTSENQQLAITYVQTGIPRQTDKKTRPKPRQTDKKTRPKPRQTDKKTRPKPRQTDKKTRPKPRQTASQLTAAGVIG
jgi:hypothetical protein